MLLFLTVPWVGLQFVTMVFPDHTRLLFHSIVHDRFYVFYGVGYIIKIRLILVLRIYQYMNVWMNYEPLIKKIAENGHLDIPMELPIQC